MRNLAKKILRHYAVKSHDVTIQMALSTIYGLVDIFGLTGAFAIIMKNRKKMLKKKPNV